MYIHYATLYTELTETSPNVITEVVHLEDPQHLFIVNPCVMRDIELLVARKKLY